MIAKKGYDIAEVDEYLATLESVVKSYKEKDTAIKNAILHAQIAGDGIINEAKEYAKTLLDDLADHFRDIKSAISDQALILDDFIQDYNFMIGKYLNKVNESEFANLKKKLSDLENHYTRIVSKNLSLTGKNDEPNKPL